METPITEELLLAAGYEKRQTRTFTNVFWKDLHGVWVFIHEKVGDGTWPTGLHQYGDTVSIPSLRFMDELAMLERLLDKE